MDSPVISRSRQDGSLLGVCPAEPVIRGRRLAVEHILEMLAAGDTPEAILEGYPWLERDDIRACLEYAHRLVGHERIELFSIKVGA